MKLFFSHMVRGLQNFKLVKSFQLGVVRHAQSYWKQISLISKVNSGMNLICLWLGIHKYILCDLVLSYGCGQAHQGIAK